MENTQTPTGQVPEQQPQQSQQIITQMGVPNSTAVLVLGILSIVVCWCYGLPGIVLGVIALVMSGKSAKLVRENSERYTENSIKNLKAGKICAIIGTSLSSLYFFIIIVYLIIIGAAIGTAFTLAPWEQFM
ncbi:MAG: CCC motif membrane protein [Bacteroidales bacterium]|jgi:type III secretory pathway component EscV